MKVGSGMNSREIDKYCLLLQEGICINYALLQGHQLAFLYKFLNF
jgi:hypothetical protein